MLNGWSCAWAADVSRYNQQQASAAVQQQIHISEHQQQHSSNAATSPSVMMQRYAGDIIMLELPLFLLQDGFVKNVTDVVKIGDVVKVKVLSVDVAGKRLALSRKGLSPRPAAAAGAAAAADDVEDGECGRAKLSTWGGGD